MLSVCRHVSASLVYPGQCMLARLKQIETFDFSWHWTSVGLLLMWSSLKMGVCQTLSLNETTLPVLHVPVMLCILKCPTAHQTSFMEGLGPVPRATKVLLPHVAQGFSPPHCKDSCISGAAVAAAVARRTLGTNPRARSSPEMSSRMQKIIRQADLLGSARRPIQNARFSCAVVHQAPAPSDLLFTFTYHSVRPWETPAGPHARPP